MSSPFTALALALPCDVYRVTSTSSVVVSGDGIVQCASQLTVRTILQSGGHTLASSKRAIQLRAPPGTTSSLPSPACADNPLRFQVLASSRTLSAEAFNKVYGEIHTRCFALVNSPDLQDKLAGITAIGSLSRAPTLFDLR